MKKAKQKLSKSNTKKLLLFLIPILFAFCVAELKQTDSFKIEVNGGKS